MTSPNLRSAYGASLVRLGKKDERVVALEADLGKSTQSVMFQAEFPDRYFQMGIAEQNMASTAAGFALSGMIPFIHSFAVFASGRDLRSAAQFHLHSESARAHLRVQRRAFRLWRWKDPPGRRGRCPDAGAAQHDSALPGGLHRSGEDDGLHAGLAGAGVLQDQQERSSFRISGGRAVLDRQGDKAAGRKRCGDLRLGGHGLEGAGGREGSGSGRDFDEGAQRQHHQAAGPRGGDPLCARSGCHRHGRRAFGHRRNRLGSGGGAARGESRACGVRGHT